MRKRILCRTGTAETTSERSPGQRVCHFDQRTGNGISVFGKLQLQAVTTSSLAFCDEIKACLTGYVRSGEPYTANGAAEMIKEIIAQLKNEGLVITFRMDSGYFDGAILETIESLGGKYVIKGKGYPIPEFVKVVTNNCVQWRK